MVTRGVQRKQKKGLHSHGTVKEREMIITQLDTRHVPVLSHLIFLAPITLECSYY